MIAAYNADDRFEVGETRLAVSEREIELRGYVRRMRAGDWYAHCVTLSIDAVGESHHEAERKLDEAIILYVKTVAEDGRLDAMIPRPSPLRYRAEYWGVVAYTVARRLWSGVSELFNRPSQPRKVHERVFHRSLPPADVAA